MSSTSSRGSRPHASLLEQLLRLRQPFLWPVLAVLASSCIYRVEVELLETREAVGTTVESPFKAFLTDGRIAVFPEGARVTTDSVLGAGTRYSLDLATLDPVNAIALDDLLGLESMQVNFDFPVTVGVYAASTAAGVGMLFGALYLFGSCPTIYSYDQSGEILEAEAFSYSIAPLFEGRDVDRLGVGADASGVVRLELRNEALETHYINHLELLEVRHEADRKVYPNEEGRILVVGETTEPTNAIDRDGSDRLVELIAHDGAAFSSSDERIRAVTAEDFRDHIDLTFPRPDSRSAALVLRLRNSLLNTILFYDIMLASRGAEALDWLGEDLANIGEAVELGQWFQETMGLEVSVRGPDGWERVARLADTGPLAWDKVAIQLPVPERDEFRVRLSFLADEWRIDFAGLAGEAEFVEPTVASFARVAPIDGAHDPEVAARIALSDEDYLVTGPSTALSLESESLGAYSEDERTFFLSSQGYYTEWIRPDWIRSSDRPAGFQPSGETVVRLMERWREEKDEFQKRFFETRIPVR